jgi:DNA-binding LacI/PurR family transcriptional regulator
MKSIKDIAKLAGVSPSTVSRVVNNKKYVKMEVRDRIMALVEETGYVANNAASSSPASNEAWKGSAIGPCSSSSTGSR